MPVLQNPDGTLWIELADLNEVDAISRRLRELAVPVSVLIADPDSFVQADWGDLYPKIVPRNGPQPGIVVQPAEIPEGHVLLLAAHRNPRRPPGRDVVAVLRLIKGDPGNPGTRPSSP